MKAVIYIDYENGVARVDGTVDGMTAHHKREWDAGAGRDHIEAVVRLMCQQVPKFAWHPEDKPCGECRRGQH